jgi:SPP1 family predicted phage head-tail adaptor
MPTPTITAGDLRQRIEVQAQRLPVLRDEIGGVTEVWERVGLRWAQVEPLQGRELEAARAIEARVTHRVTLRYMAGLTPQHRLLLETRVFNIAAVLDLEERHIMHQVLCIEVQS